MLQYPSVLPQIGDTLVYKLHERDNPVNPDFLHAGKIVNILVSVVSRPQQRYYLVMPDEHPDCEELVYPEQVQGFYQ